MAPASAQQATPADASTSQRISAILGSLGILPDDLAKINYRPVDVVHGFIAQNKAAGQPISRVYADIAHVMSSRGQPDLAVTYLRRSLANVADREIHDRLFHALMLAPSTTNETILNEAVAWSKTHYVTAASDYSFSMDRVPERPLRIAYTCCFFYGLGTRISILPLMILHDRSKFTVIAYSDEDVEDTFKVADIWRKTGDLDDDAFAKLVRDDKIDILVELNGRGGRNRFDAFAQRIAPVQVNFGNFVATTGLPAVDYTITLEDSVPPEEDEFYTEKVARLKNWAIDFKTCWPQDFFPPVAPPPFRKTGRITFGCFGGSVKVNEELIKNWCAIVNRVTGSRLYFKSMSMSDPGTLAAFQALFEKYGLSGEQLILEGGSDHKTMLELYGMVDIALDTFPYNGGNTTLEALWQGIPVVTLEGDRWASRTGKSILAVGGQDTFVTKSWDEYIDRAVVLASDHDFRDHFRRTSRDQLLASRLFDMPGYARELERVYRDMWHRWLQDNSNSP